MAKREWEGGQFNRALLNRLKKYGIAVGTMNKNKFFWVFSICAAFYWSCSWWGYHLFMCVRNFPNYYAMVLLPILLLLFLPVVYAIAQTLVLKKRRSSLIPIKVVISLIGLYLVWFLAIYLSLKQDSSGWDVFLSDIKSHHLGTYLGVILNSKGMDLGLCFLLALLSGHIVYSQESKFDTKGFIAALLLWLLLISINEMVIQQFLLFYRSGSITDILSNMVGVLIGLALSSKWLWM